MPDSIAPNSATNPSTAGSVASACHYDLAALRRLRARFPANFTWGVATSAFQIEGAVAADGRGDSIWDTFCRVPGAISDGSNADRACDHYHRLDEDLDLIAALGVQAYRFSVSWPRVQALGYGPWNEAGFDFYERLISGLARRGVTAHLTLHHWDLPQGLQDRGGWAHRETAYAFATYASEVVRRFGARCASIATHNEPWVMSVLGYEQGIFAPGWHDRKAAMQVSHHLLLGHGLALQNIRAQGCTTPLGIVLNQSPVHPLSDDPQDLAKARIDDGLNVRWYMDPLLFGRYPEDILAYLTSDAPQIQPGDMNIIAQPLDFLGINYYTRSRASAAGPVQPPAEAELTDMGWEVYPDGLTELLLRLKADYPLPPLYITENGAAFKDALTDGKVDDEQRVRFLLSHMAATASALEQGVDLRGYFVWSLFDNFEWASGLSKRFGIVYVDYDTQVRTLKESAHMYRQFLCGV